MFSTFHGLETAKRGMNTQQSALYVTGQNISNANTLGYTRQRVNFEASPAYPAASMNRPQIPGQMGTGYRQDRYSVYVNPSLTSNIVVKIISSAIGVRKQSHLRNWKTYE